MNIANLSASDILAALQNNTITVAEVARKTSELMQQNSDINAVISTDIQVLNERAQELDDKFAAGESLRAHGLPVLVKDNIDTVDFPTTGGTAALAKHQPTEDAGVIKKLKQAGAMIVGKANMHELAFGITSNNACTGAVHNPYNLDLIAGGSSGGSAAAVAAGIVAVALGSDTGGSNRIPASLCGVCGFRPTTGRYPGDGLINLSLTRDTVGVFAHNVEDIALIDGVLSDTDELPVCDLKNVILAVPRDPFFKGLDKETEAVIEQALSLLNAAGATLIEIDIKELFSLQDKVSFPVALYETVRELEDYLQRNKLGLTVEELTATIVSPDVKHIMEAALSDQRIPEEVYLEALNVHRPLLQKMYADFFNDNSIDAMLYPTTILPARPIGDDETVELNGERHPTFPGYARNGDPSSNSDLPSLSIPAGLTSDGLPVGLSIDGPVNSDIKVLAIGTAISAILPAIAKPVR